jgi:hypothetical protein
LSDRQANQNITKSSDQPIMKSYCLYVRRSGERLRVGEAPLHGRVADHPKRQSFQCYYGIPLFGSKGKMLGTVCHFDGMPVRVTEEVATAPRVRDYVLGENPSVECSPLDSPPPRMILWRSPKGASRKKQRECSIYFRATPSGVEQK